MSTLPETQCACAGPLAASTVILPDDAVRWAEPQRPTCTRPLLLRIRQDFGRRTHRHASARRSDVDGVRHLDGHASRRGDHGDGAHPTHHLDTARRRADHEVGPLGHSHRDTSASGVDRRRRLVDRVLHRIRHLDVGALLRDDPNRPTRRRDPHGRHRDVGLHPRDRTRPTPTPTENDGIRTLSVRIPRSFGVGGAGQSRRSMMVALAMPPPSHITCRP